MTAVPMVAVLVVDAVASLAIIHFLSNKLLMQITN